MLGLPEYGVGPLGNWRPGWFARLRGGRVVPAAQFQMRLVVAQTLTGRASGAVLGGMARENACDGWRDS
jgi:hypothetical protein